MSNNNNNNINNNIENNDLFKKLHTIDCFEGKRNAVITLIFYPKSNFYKVIDHVDRQVRAIKHVNKRKQILKVIRLIKQRNEDRNLIPKNGLIVCAAHDKLGAEVYHEIELNVHPSPTIVPKCKFDYYYGYKFNGNKIKHVLFNNNICQMEPKEQNEMLNFLAQNILNTNSNVVLKDKIDVAIESNLVHKIIFLQEELPLDLLINAKNCNAVIYLMNLNNIMVKEFVNKFGDILGILHYPVDLDFFDN
jgi:hypothetical protein